MRQFSLILFVLWISGSISAQQPFFEELVEIHFEEDRLESIAVLPNVGYLEQMRGGTAINALDNLYYFTGFDARNGDSYIYTVDINTGAILHQILKPEIKLIQYHEASDRLVGLVQTDDGSTTVSLMNYETGEMSHSPLLPDLFNRFTQIHHSTIDNEKGIYYFLGSVVGSNTWQLFSWDLNTNTYLGGFDVEINDRPIFSMAIDKDRKIILALAEVDPGALSLVGINQEGPPMITEIERIDDMQNTWGGHRYWAYNDADDEYYVIGIGQDTESYLYVLDSNTGEVLYKNPYPNDVWIMLEHSPLELRYSPGTQQLLGLRMGPPLVSSNEELDWTSSQELEVFPNPAGPQGLQLRLPEGLQPLETLSLFSSNGQEVYFWDNLNTRTFELPTAGLDSGVYLLVGVTANRVYSRKVIIRH